MAYETKVTITIPKISSVPTVYEIHKTTGRRKTKLGELHVSEGGIKYVPNGHSKTYVNITWDKFHKEMVKLLE